MTEQKTKRRGWVKNAIIIFLAVMLVLVFFSNTIMNRSLPEVATQYTNSGAINAMVRGTGTATANETYEVKLDQVRTVQAVYVRVGDTVEPNTLLFKLRDGESDDLAALREQLETEEYNYQIALLDASIGDGGQTNRDIQRTREALEAAKAELEALELPSQEKVDALKSRIADLVILEQVRKAMLEEAQEALDALGGLNPGNPGSASADQMVAQAKKAQDEAINNYQSVYMRYGMLYEVIESIGKALYEKQTTRTYTKEAFMEAIAAEFGAETPTASGVPGAGNVFVSAPNTSAPDTSESEDTSGSGGTSEGTPTPDYAWIKFPIDSDNTYKKSELAAAYNFVVKARNDMEAAKQSYYDALNSRAESINPGNEHLYGPAKQKRDAAQTAYNQVQRELEDKNKQLDSYDQQSRDYKDAKANVNTLSDSLENLLVQQRQQGVNQSKEAMALERQRKELEALRTKVESMATGGELVEVYANASGVVRSISVSAGSKAPADTPVATIEVTDRGYSLTMPVTMEQAEKVRVGDSAEVTGSYWGSKINAVLTSIRNDPSKPGQGKLLLFSLTGDLESGSTLNIAIGQRSQYYDVVVPNSAIREDSDGTYVFVVEAKNSPLGNRYYATKVNVEVLAKDDDNSAVSGNLSGWSTSVITSAPPLKSGTQVRLAENG